MKHWIANNKITVLAIILFFVALITSALDVRLKTVKYKIYDPRISKATTIALLTDLHSCRYGEAQHMLINAIKKQSPDIILFGGDICDDDIPHTNTEILLSAIGNQYPCYYVTGNHENANNDVGAIKDMIRSNGVVVLEGETKNIDISGQLINISGIDDPIRQFGDVNNELENCVKSLDNRFYSILLTHRPEYIKTYLKYPFDLVVAGHAHGGQWRIPFILNGLYAPNQGWFPKYAGGLYNFNNSKMIVSRGLAIETTKVPRIFNRPELVIIKLLPSL